ncbi:MAG: LamG-like jellyroll fold domain-containing protein [Lutibacter sp.]|nr:LamG-like jellyroll fold domain-containing protein [Lutibacter sp.]
MKKIITLLLFSLFANSAIAQTTINSQNFDVVSTGLGYSVSNASVIQVTNTFSESPSNSLRFAGNGTLNNVLFNNVDISAYTNVTVTVSFKVTGVDSGEDLFLETSYDGGINYVSTKLVDGDGGENINWGSPDTDGTTSSNPYTFNVPNGNTQLRIRIRAISSSSTEYFYIDNILIKGFIPVPEINLLGNGTSIVNGDILPSITDFTDFGSTSLSSPLTRTFTVQNTGSANLTVSNIALSNTTDFLITGTPYVSPISAGGSTTFTVTFNALTIGTKTSVVTVSNNDSDEPSYQFTIEANTQQNFFDSDGDTIADNIDIDDDNDGIKDSDEENTCKNSPIASVSNYKFLNETFGAGTRTTINTTYDAVTTYCYENGTVGTNTTSCPTLSDTSLNDGEYTVGASAQIASWANDYWYMGVDHTGDANGRMALFNASYAPGIFYTANIKGALPNIPITYSFWVLNLDRTNAPGILTRLRPNILVEFRDVSNNVLATITTGDIAPTTNGNLAGDWYNFTADLTLNVDEFYVYFINNETGGLGNDLAIDDIEITQTLCDTDSDSVADVFDLDSDNDGIPDVVESGWGNLSNGTAKIPYPAGWVDTNFNGMHDSVENNIALDTDIDSVPNYLDLDSDNDSIFDVDESGAGNSDDVNFQNGDGDINGDGVGDGSDLDAVREKDFDSNGASEYFTDGILDIYDYYNGIDFAAAYGNSNQGLGNTYFIKDTDNDGTPDYMDTTSNGATFDILHTLYAGLDATNNGIIDGNTDIDRDGILDSFDTNTAVFGSPRDLNRKLHLYFDGRNDYGEDVSSVLSGLSEATLMGWIKIDAASASEDKVILGQNMFYLQLNANKTVNATANGKTISAATAVTTNQWIHVAATYSSSNSKLILFINGQKIDSVTVSGALPLDVSSFTLGRKPNANSNYYHGYMDEARVFNKALAADELHKMVYQEIQDNAGNVRGSVIPRDVTNYVNTVVVPTVLPWGNLKRYFRMDAYKDDIMDDLTTGTIDVGVGAKIYNMKIIDVQNAPLPFVTQVGDTTLPNAVNIPLSGVNGNDAITYDWSIVKIEHKNIAYNANQKHLGLFVNDQDANSNPIEFSIQNDSELNVSWYLKLDGFIDLEGESQLVQGDDSILDENSGGYIERDQQGTANSFNYNYWSSSVGPIGIGVGSNNAGYAISGVLKDGTSAASPGAITFLPAYWAADAGVTTPIIVSSYWLYAFNGADNDYWSWKSIDQNTLLLAGEGYTMKGTSGGVAITNQQNYVFKGKPNSGNIALPILAGNDRLIGNPYPSAMDADEFIKDNIKETINSKAGRNTKNIFNGALYFWDHFGEINTHILREYVGGYATFNLIGGAKAISNDVRINDNNAEGTKIPQQFIPVGQGFFVIAVLDANLTNTTTTIDGGDIVFKNTQRIFKTEASGNSVFMKGTNAKSASTASEKKEKEKDNDENNSNSIKRSRIWLQFDSPSGYHRQLLVGLDKNASNHFDLGYDAPIADVNKEDMFWAFDEGKFVIQGVDNFDKKQELPLGLVIFKAGLARIKIDAIENLDKKTKVFVKDKLTGITHEISKNPFEINLEPGDYFNRFSVTFNPGKNKENHEEGPEEEQVNNDHKQNNADLLSTAGVLLVYMNNTTAELQITKPVDAEITTVNLYNYLGQNIKSWTTNLNANFLSLPINVASGAYIVQINTKNGPVVQKVIVE